MVYELVVNYDLSLVKMIEAGAYDLVDWQITEANFPKKGGGEVQVSAGLISLKRRMESEEVVDEMDRLGLRPAVVHELLAFGRKYPDVQREFLVVALGSSCVIDFARRVACLDGDCSRRCVDLDWHDETWRASRYRFLAIRR